MELSYDTIRRLILEPLYDDGTVTDYAHEYGEPGYNFGYGAETPMFLIGSWWCRCGDNPHAGKPKPWGDEFYTASDLHGISDHHPRLWAQLESQGVETAFDDEWTVIDDKAYRTQPDSYSWQSSIQYDEDSCEYLTPDDDIETWIEWAVNDPERCLMADYRSQLAGAGFVQWEPDDPHRYESGWHPGQTDDPKTVTDEIRQTYSTGLDVDIVFVLDETSQFYVGFSAWTRPTEEAGMKRVTPGPGRRVVNQGPERREGWVLNHSHPLPGWVWVHWDDIGVTDELIDDLTEEEELAPQ